jgi:hypothetical protein
MYGQTVRGNSPFWYGYGQSVREAERVGWESPAPNMAHASNNGLVPTLTAVSTILNTGPRPCTLTSSLTETPADWLPTPTPPSRSAATRARAVLRRSLGSFARKVSVSSLVLGDFRTVRKQSCFLVHLL